MENIETYWQAVSYATGVISIVVEGWFFCYYVTPFLTKNKRNELVGISYSGVMVVVYFIPLLVFYPRILGGITAFLVMCTIDRKNISQKIFLVITMYLLQRIAQGISLVPRSLMFSLCINTGYMAARTSLQFIMYIFVELLTCLLRGLLLYWMVHGIHKVYVNKRENVSRRELLLLLSMLFTVLTGYFAFSAFSDIYVKDTGVYIWNEHKGYNLLETIYQIVSCSAIFVTIVVYQRIKKKQKEEKENMILTEQIENIKNHIGEVEKLYSDIRGLKHDMGNHISVLENLFMKNEKDEVDRYLSELKTKWGEDITNIKTGNPVTDVILTKKQKDAEERGITFTCDFFYPSGTRLEAFDFSVMLNNAIENALEGTEGSSNPFVSVISYRKKNAFMIEIKNSIYKAVELDKETGLPASTKPDRKNHGFGLANIRKVAQKYYGDIDIEQKDNTFLLSILLMVE